jgi:hypothetical protein
LFSSKPLDVSSNVMKSNRTKEIIYDWLVFES